MKVRFIIPTLFAFGSLFGKAFKRKKVAKTGDDVFLKPKYRRSFPGIPLNHPLRIEDVRDAHAKVYWVTTQELLTETIPLKALSVIP